MKYENNHPIFQNKIELKRDALLMQAKDLGDYVSRIKLSDEFLVIFKETDDLKKFSRISPHHQKRFTHIAFVYR